MEETEDDILYKCTRDKSMECKSLNIKGIFKIIDDSVVITFNIFHIKCDNNASCRNLELSDDSVKLYNSTGSLDISKCLNDVVSLSFSEPR